MSTTFNEQSRDVFKAGDAGILFDTNDETWTIDSGILVSSGANAGVSAQKPTASSTTTARFSRRPNSRRVSYLRAIPE